MLTIWFNSVGDAWDQLVSLVQIFKYKSATVAIDLVI